MRFSATALAIWLLSRAVLAGETLFVQPVKTALRAAPQMSAPAVLELQRGEAVQLLRKDGLWFEVSYKEPKGAATRSGWISKLFVSPNRPVGQAELAKEMGSDQNLAKANRRRASSYAVSAATRGLTAGNRVRESREKYDSDPEAVSRLEALNVPQEEVRKFAKDANLNW